MVELLLAKGADVNAKSIKSQTPLHFAAAHGHTDAARMLLESGADPSIRTTSEEETPLDCAVSAGHEELAELIRRHSQAQWRDVSGASSRYTKSGPWGRRPSPA
jgi:ankyrin repeat protein